MKNGFNINEVDFTRLTSVDFDDIRAMSRDMAEIDEDEWDQPTIIDQARWDEISRVAAIRYTQYLAMRDPLGWKT